MIHFYNTNKAFDDNMMLLINYYDGFDDNTMFRESLERLSQQERCIAGLEARLAEATMARNEEQVTMAKNQEANIVKQEEGRPSDFEENNNSRGMIAQMAEKLAKKKRSKEDEIMGEERSRRGSSSSREFRVEEEMEEEEEMERNAKGGRRGSSSSREFQHEGEVGLGTRKTNAETESDTNSNPKKDANKNVPFQVGSSIALYYISLYLG